MFDYTYKEKKMIDRIGTWLPWKQTNNGHSKQIYCSGTAKTAASCLLHMKGR